MRKRSREPILLLMRWEQKNGRQAVWAVAGRRSASCRPCENRPRDSADATSHVQVPCQTPIWDELGIYRTNWADLPRRVERITPVGGANRPSGRSESPHYLRGGEAIRPAPPRPLGSPPQLARPHRAAAVTTGHGHRRRGPRPRKTSPWCAGTAEYSGLSVKASGSGPWADLLGGIGVYIRVYADDECPVSPEVSAAGLRIANPPSSVRLRPEPLNRRPSRCPGNPGLRGGFFVFSRARLGVVSSPRAEGRKDMPSVASPSPPRNTAGQSTLRCPARRGLRIVTGVVVASDRGPLAVRRFRHRIIPARPALEDATGSPSAIQFRLSTE